MSMLEERKIKMSVPSSVADQIRNHVADNFIRDIISKEARDQGTITLSRKASNDGRERVYDLAKLRELDFEQKRRTLNGNQLDAVIELTAAGWMLDDANHRLEDFLKDNAAWASSRAAAGMTHKTIRTIRNRFSSVQNIAVGNILADADAYITCPGKNLPPHCINVEVEAMWKICSQAMRHCSETCHKSRKQSKDCPLRRALCMVPGLKETAEMDPFRDDAHCIFYFMETEDDDVCQE